MYWHLGNDEGSQADVDRHGGVLLLAVVEGDEGAAGHLGDLGAGEAKQVQAHHLEGIEEQWEDG